MIPALNCHYHNAGSKFPATPGQYDFSMGALSCVLDNAATYLTSGKTGRGSLDKTASDQAAVIMYRNNQLTTPANLEGLTPQEQQQMVRSDVDAIVEYHPAEIRGDTPDELIRIASVIGNPTPKTFLVAVSMRAVLFGASTCIGNGPNFKVKSITDHAGTTTPSFFGYIRWYTIPVLLPSHVALWWLFIR